MYFQKIYDNTVHERIIFQNFSELNKLIFELEATCKNFKCSLIKLSFESAVNLPSDKLKDHHKNINSELKNFKDVLLKKLHDLKILSWNKKITVFQEALEKEENYTKYNNFCPEGLSIKDLFVTYEFFLKKVYELIKSQHSQNIINFINQLQITCILINNVESKYSHISQINEILYKVPESKNDNQSVVNFEFVLYENNLLNYLEVEKLFFQILYKIDKILKKGDCSEKAFDAIKIESGCFFAKLLGSTKSFDFFKLVYIDFKELMFRTFTKTGRDLSKLERKDLLIDKFVEIKNKFEKNGVDVSSGNDALKDVYENVVEDFSGLISKTKVLKVDDKLVANNLEYSLLDYDNYQQKFIDSTPQLQIEHKPNDSEKK